LKFNQRGGNISRLLEYGSQVIRNPRWIMSYNYLNAQIQEFIYYFYFDKLVHVSRMQHIKPYLSYIRWDEHKITSTLTNELNWKKRADVASSWRSDCHIALLKLYIYKKAFGFNDKLDNLSHLVRDGQLNREDALQRLEKEETISEDIIKEIVENAHIPHQKFNKAVNGLLKR
jgi:glutamine---fructose-6-phosphate transaminase (isomerizing)